MENSGGHAQPSGDQGPEACTSLPPKPPGSGAHEAIQMEGSGAVELEEGEELCDHTHASHRNPWLRAFVLGANDGLVSTAALMMGVGAGTGDLGQLRLAGVASLVGGALSMAVGEYISVASQRDAERADIEKERREQLLGPAAQARELEELAQIYVARGLPYDLARRVAVAMTEHDVIRAHARDELGIDIDELANPLQAAVVSALTFTCGACIPLLAGAFITSQSMRLLAILLSTTAALLVFGVMGSVIGGAKLWRGAARVLIGGWMALGVVYGIGRAFNVSSGG